MLTSNGIPAIKSKSAFGETARNNELLTVPSAYFRKIEKLIGKEELKNKERVVIVIWKGDLPIKVIGCLDGDIIIEDVGSKYPSMDAFQILELIEKEMEDGSFYIYDVAVKNDDFVFYEEQN